jgi:hypothetical protein
MTKGGREEKTIQNSDRNCGKTGLGNQTTHCKCIHPSKKRRRETVSLSVA